HQVPLYAIVLAPLVRPARVPLLLWWSHWKLDLVVRTAEAVSTRVVTVGPTTFPKPSRKLVAVGQAIDADRFASEHEPHDGPLRAVVIGRYSPAKGVDTIVRAVALAAGVRLDVYGPAPNGEARRERAELERLVGELGRADRVVYEAAASRVPVLASNPAHADLLEADAFYPRGDASALAAKLRALAVADRDEIGRRLRERVRRDHSVDSWADGVLRAVSARRARAARAARRARAA